MKTKKIFLSMCVALAGPPAGLVIAGDLNPPAGPVTPTMKTLLEVEPRFVVQSLPGSAMGSYVISESGSYYLTGNVLGESVKNGIVIATDDVTLDLNGFSMIGAVDSLDGILVNGLLNNIVIKNGVVKNWRFGVMASSMQSGQLESLYAISNRNDGISAGNRTIVRACVARENAGDGITGGGQSTFIDCIAASNICKGFIVGESNVRGCVAAFNGDMGFLVVTGSTVIGCTANQNAVAGFLATHSIIRDCTAYSNVGDGIRAGGGSYVSGNLCTNNGFFNGDGAGIHIISDSSHVDGNNVHFNDRGIQADFGGNLIIRNSARSNTDNYGSIVGGNSVGPIGNAATATSPLANIEY